MDPFWLRVAASFIIGGVYISLALWISEKFGPRIGGLTVGLPTTALVGFVFIALTQDLQTAADAAIVGPAVASMGAVFAALFAHLRQRNGIEVSLAIALSIWFALAAPLAIFQVKNEFFLATLTILCLALAFYMVKDIPAQKPVQASLSIAEFAGRATFAGFIIAAAVTAAKVMGAIWGGVLANFPASYSSTLIILSKKHGPEFTSSVVSSMPYGTITVAAFSMSFHFLAIPLGLAASIAVSYAISLAIASVIYATVLSR